jgi:hypothetical protein
MHVNAMSSLVPLPLTLGEGRGEGALKLRPMSLQGTLTRTSAGLSQRERLMNKEPNSCI